MKRLATVLVAGVLAASCSGSSPSQPTSARPSSVSAASGVFRVDPVAPSVSGAAGVSGDFGRCLAGSGSAACYTATIVRPPAVVAGAVAPNAPSGLTATASGSSVTLTWSAPTSGDPVQSYVIEAGTASGLANLASFSTGNTATTFSASGVGNGTYYVRVRASNSAGISSPSNEAVLVVGSTACTTAPGSPGNLSGTVSASGTVVFTWTAASGTPTSYVIEAGSASGLSNLANSDLGGTALTFTATNVGAGTYYIRIRAKNACGLGGPSNELRLVVSTTITGMTVTSVSPDSGPISGGTTLTVRGTGFVSGATVTFGGIPAAVVTSTNANLGFITATTPAHTAGAVDVAVTNPDGQAARLANGFTYLTFTLDFISPSSGTTNGGTAVTLFGSGFVSGATVTFGGTAATNVATTSSTSMTATTPAHAAGAVDIVVTNPDGQSARRVSGYTYATPVGPTLTSITPTLGPDSGGTRVAIVGTGFTSGATVTFGGTAATSVITSSSTSMTATTPAHAAGAVEVVVTNPDEQSGRLANGYTYTGPVALTLASISPASGSVNGGTAVTITGAGFTSGATVTIGGTAATNVSVASTTSIGATTPAHSAGTADVVVTNSDGQSARLANAYTFTSVSDNFDGTWTGPTSGSGTIRFVVQNNVITSLTLTLPAGPCIATVNVTTNAAIANGAFSFVAAIGTDPTTVTGTFTSLTSGSGTMTTNSIVAVSCSGGAVGLGRPPASFTFNKS
jgi:hypothetical protein